MADQNMTYAESGAILEAVRVLEDLERRGEISPAEQRALDEYRRKRPSAEKAQVETEATYRGLQREASFRLADEIAGARAAVAAFASSGDTKRASEAFNKYRDLVRMRDEAAMLLEPEAFSRGEMTGALLSGLAPGAGVAGAASRMGLRGAMAVGGATGAGMTALPQFAGGEGGFANRMGEISPAMTAVGGVAGALAPAAGAIAGRGAEAVSNIFRRVEGLPGYTGAAGRRVAGALGSAQRAGTDIEEYLRRIGPEGMIADIPGSPQAMAQGLATMPSEGADYMRRVMLQRAEQAGPRIEAEMTRSIAGPEAAFMTQQAEMAKRSGIYSPLYEAARASDRKFNVDAIRSGITFLAQDEASEVRGALGRVLRDLGTSGEVSAAKLHATRVALSDAANMAFRSGAAGKGNVLKSLLDEIDTRLDELPDYARARAGWAESKSIDNAIEAGREAFTGGPTSAISPQVLRQNFDKLSDPQKEAFRQGAREYIAALMGTSRSDAPAAWAAFEKGWNAEKLRIILGDDAAESIMRRLRGESAYAGTRSRVLEGSQTAQRRESGEALGDIREPDTMNMPSPAARAYGVLNEATNRIINEILYGSSRSVVNRQIGQLLSLQGAERDAAVRALLNEARRLENPTRTRQITEALVTAGSIGLIPGLLSE